jgi:hypothetical protein
MFLGSEVSRTKTFDVGRVKRLEFQRMAPSVGVAASVALQPEKTEQVGFSSGADAQPPAAGELPSQSLTF